MNDIIKPKEQVLVMTVDEMTKAENNILNLKQLNFLLQPTPKNHVFQRPGKGGKDWDYVTGVYVKKVLHFVFGWDWDFEVKEYQVNMEIKQCFVLGKLTVRSKGCPIIKMQFGRADIKMKTETREDESGKTIMARDQYGKTYPKKFPTNIPLDLGNDLKAATTDALKKCASELGVASDIYGADEFREIRIVENDNPIDDLGTDLLNYKKKVFNLIKEKLAEPERTAYLTNLKSKSEANELTIEYLEKQIIELEQVP